MHFLERLHPVAMLCYFVPVIGIAMFQLNPVLMAISAIGAATLFLTIRRRTAVSGGLRRGLFTLLLFLGVAALNPLFYHNGETVLLFVNGNPITLEAVCYGFVTAAALFTVLLWFRSLSLLLTSDRLQCLLGTAAPRLALLFSMTLRFLPDFAKQYKKILSARRLLGAETVTPNKPFMTEPPRQLGAETAAQIQSPMTEPPRQQGAETVAQIQPPMTEPPRPQDSPEQEPALPPVTLTDRLHAFSAVVTWSLEHSLETADAMKARGYGSKCRTQFLQRRLTAGEWTFSALCCLLTGIVLYGLGRGALTMTYYPALHLSPPTNGTYAAYAAYGCLVALLPAMEWRKRCKWRYLQSKL